MYQPTQEELAEWTRVRNSVTSSGCNFHTLSHPNDENQNVHCITCNQQFDLDDPSQVRLAAIGACIVITHPSTIEFSTVLGEKITAPAKYK